MTAAALVASSTFAQADVLTEANNLGAIADQLSAHLKDGYKFAIGVTEGINQWEFAATHAEQEYYFTNEDIVVFNTAYQDLMNAQAAIAEEYLDNQIEQNQMALTDSVDSFVSAAGAIMTVVETAQEANTATTEQEAVAVQEYIAGNGGGEITVEMQTSYNTALTDVATYSRNISVLTSARNNADITDYMNYEIEQYNIDPYAGVLNITAQYDLILDMQTMALGVAGETFFAEGERMNSIFIEYGTPIYDAMFGPH